MKGSAGKPVTLFRQQARLRALETGASLLAVAGMETVTR